MNSFKDKQILFIHGAGEDGYQWDQPLVSSLESLLGKQYTLIYPKMHSVESKPDFGWVDQIEESVAGIHDPFVLIGHSLGASMILKYLTQSKPIKSIKGVFLLATPFWDGEEDWVKGIKLMDDFAKRLDVNLNLYFYHCLDDEVVLISHLHEYVRQLSYANFRVIKTGGHQFTNDLSMVAADVKSLF